MPWKGNSYFAGGKQVKTWRSIRDADGGRVLVDPTTLIDWFDDFLGTHPYVCLSNYYIGEPLVVGGHEYMTGEHAFQAGKASSETGRAKVQACKDPDAAKLTGRTIRMRSDWDDVSPGWMRKVIAAKFKRGREEADVLLSTGQAKLVEGTLWHDSRWGVDLEEVGRPGENLLGKILMAQRGRLQAKR